MNNSNDAMNGTASVKKDGKLGSCGCDEREVAHPTPYCDSCCPKGCAEERHVQERTLVGSFASMVIEEANPEGTDPLRMYDGDEELFADPPEKEECAVCCLPMSNHGELFNQSAGETGVYQVGTQGFSVMFVHAAATDSRTVFHRCYIIILLSPYRSGMLR